MVEKEECEVGFGLRPYQENLLKRIETALEGDARARVMMQLPTGGGKTRIAGQLLLGWLGPGRKGAWLTHRRELAGQSRNELEYGGVQANADLLWSPGSPAPSIKGGVVVLMAQTVGRRNVVDAVWADYGPGDLLLIDEAHHATAAGWERAIRQWPGCVVGVTATPWRLSRKEGFDHLFHDLICGPTVAELRSKGFLCRARVVVPKEDDRVVGGEVGTTGDYTESGIELANAAHEDVMTGNAVRLWHREAEGRPTIAYAVSVRHARNLAAFFEAADVRSAVLLGDMEGAERLKVIRRFKAGEIRILVNVAVATEGFDVPDAACVVIARPTTSLTLYLQMVGRGLRPKRDSCFDDCVILDLAGNSLVHGRPERSHRWSLAPRKPDSGPVGEPPVVWCPHCGAVSPTGAHHCVDCAEPFGEECRRCGRWRRWRSWEYENLCGDRHDPVCDLCHVDAHVDAHLPLPPGFVVAAGVGLEEDGMPDDDMAIDDELAEELGRGLRKLLKSELAAALSADVGRVAELRRWIATDTSMLESDEPLARGYEDHLATLDESERPRNRPQESRRFMEYENSLRSGVAAWREELESLENRPINDRSVLDGARKKVLYLMRREALVLDLDTYRETPDAPSRSLGSAKGWHALASLYEMPDRPAAVRFPDGTEAGVSSGQALYREVVEWLIRAGALAEGSVDDRLRRWLRYDSRSSKELSNGMWLYTNLKRDKMLENCRLFVSACGEDASGFHVLFA